MALTIFDRFYSCFRYVTLSENAVKVVNREHVR